MVAVKTMAAAYTRKEVTMENQIFYKCTGTDKTEEHCFAVALTKEVNGMALWTATQWDDGPCFTCDKMKLWWNTNDAIIEAVKVWEHGSADFAKHFPKLGGD